MSEKPFEQPFVGEGIFILPSFIDEGAWVEFLKFIHANRERATPLRIICTSQGGYYTPGTAIAQMIGEHGDCIGYLVGNACSGASLIFAACQRRYAVMGSTIQVHGIQMEWTGTISAVDVICKAAEAKTLNRVMAGIYARATKLTVDQWYHLLTYRANAASLAIGYTTLRKIGMVEPMPEGGVFHP